MKKVLLILILLFGNSLLFADQNAYQLLNGLWDAHSEGDMDVILTVDTEGQFDLSIIPAFEFTNMSAVEQSNVIQQHVSTEGYFKVLNVLDPVDSGVLAYTEILLNGEYSTNILNIMKETIFIYDKETKSQELFMQKSSF